MRIQSPKNRIMQGDRNENPVAEKRLCKRTGKPRNTLLPMEKKKKAHTKSLIGRSKRRKKAWDNFRRCETTKLSPLAQLLISNHI